MRHCYREINFKKTTLDQIAKINEIIAEYQSAGYVLTVRQLFYQLVSRDIIANTEKTYKNTASIVNDARIAGLIDWDAIEDRTRSFQTRSRFNSPKDVLHAAARSYHTDPWATQKTRPFVIVEKEALVGVFERVCDELDVPLLAARGYPSASVMREFASRHVAEADQTILVLHFGDHDPSGIDMTRDIDERVELFSGYAPFELKRMALNLDQIKKYNPPPNPAKVTDARFIEYKRKYGVSSWELDALPPNILAELARTELDRYIDKTAWKKWHASVEKSRKKLRALADGYAE